MLEENRKRKTFKLLLSLITVEQLQLKKNNIGRNPFTLYVSNLMIHKRKIMNGQRHIKHLRMKYII